jgi:hypothetical protein
MVNDTLDLVLRLAQAGGRLTIGPDEVLPDAISIQAEIPDGKGGVVTASQEALSCMYGGHPMYLSQQITRAIRELKMDEQLGAPLYEPEHYAFYNK